MAATACCSFSGGNSADRLSDLNPNDIERVEVLKAPLRPALRLRSDQRRHSGLHQEGTW